ncbi:MAG TPA: hypothetical protein VHB79_14585 [Polyangiaceae bacterium]|nr:hypothetical protein [Polyangiaceae bacterium]
MRRLLHLVVPCLTVLSGCYGTDKGVEVPQDEIYFPVGLALDPRAAKPDFLYVVSSDFDLQYNGGAVQSYDLRTLEGDLAQPCPDGLCPATKSRKVCAKGEQDDADRLLYPGPCKSLTPSDYQRGTVKIGAFATDAIIRQNDAESDLPRLFVPVRGDATLHFIDVDEDGGLDCGQFNNEGACDKAHRAGEEPSDNVRGLKLAAEPFGVDADPKGKTLVVTNQTTGTASLFVTGDWSAGPKLQFALSSDRIPQRPIGVVNVPRAEGDSATDADGETYMVTFRDSAQVRLMHFAPDFGSDPNRPFLSDGGGVGIDANSSGTDSRGIAIDDSLRKDAEKRCAGDDKCLAQAALVPLDVYVANRSPASLLIGRTHPPSQFPYFYDTVPLTVGPSKVTVGKIKTPSGEYETRVFVICFDSRRIFIYDPLRLRIETEIFTARGPHAIAVDTERKLLYVGHFTDSYLGVYSLDLAFPETYGTMLGALGTPKAPRSSK